MWTDSATIRAFMDTNPSRPLLRDLCEKRPPLLKEPDVHGLGPKQMRMVRESQHPMPPRYPLMCA